jgi:hypothetical protein
LGGFRGFLHIFAEICEVLHFGENGKGYNWSQIIKSKGALI